MQFCDVYYISRGAGLGIVKAARNPGMYVYDETNRSWILSLSLIGIISFCLENTIEISDLIIRNEIYLE